MAWVSVVTLPVFGSSWPWRQRVEDLDSPLSVVDLGGAHSKTHIRFGYNVSFWLSVIWKEKTETNHQAVYSAYHLVVFTPSLGERGVGGAVGGGEPLTFNMCLPLARHYTQAFSACCSLTLIRQGNWDAEMLGNLLQATQARKKNYLVPKHCKYLLLTDNPQNEKHHLPLV